MGATNQERGRRRKIGPTIGLVLAGFMAPGAAQGRTADRVATHAERACDVATGLYQVAPGDDLGDIAQRFRVTASSLEQQKDLHASAIQVGQRLSVPDEPASAAVGMDPGRPAAPALSGPWVETDSTPAGLDDMASRLAAEGCADLLNGGGIRAGATVGANAPGTGRVLAPLDKAWHRSPPSLRHHVHSKMSGVALLAVLFAAAFAMALAGYAAIR